MFYYIYWRKGRKTKQLYQIISAKECSALKGNIVTTRQKKEKTKW